MAKIPQYNPVVQDEVNFVDQSNLLQQVVGLDCPADDQLTNLVNSSLHLQVRSHQSPFRIKALRLKVMM